MRRGPLTLGALLARFGTAAPALPEETARPWMVVAVASVGAVLAGAALIVAIGSALMALGLEETTGTLAGGLAALAAGVVLARLDGSVFVRQFAVTAGVAGQVLLSAAGYLLTDSIGGAAVTAAVVAAVSWPLLRDGTYHFVSAAIAVVMANIALLDVHGLGPPLLSAVTVAAALALLLHPPRGADLRPTALALVLAPLPVLPMLGAPLWRTADALPYALGTLWLLGPLLKGHLGRAAVTAGGVLALAALLPGAAAALLVLALAWRLNSKVLAGIGIAALAAFVVQFYYAMEVTLLAKSGLLLAGGVLTLGLWGLTRRRGAQP